MSTPITSQQMYDQWVDQNTKLQEVITQLSDLGVDVNNLPLDQAVTDSQLQGVITELQTVVTRLNNLGVEVNNLPSTQAVSGTVSVNNLPDTQNVKDSEGITELQAIKTDQKELIGTTNDNVMELLNLYKSVNNVGGKPDDMSDAPGNKYLIAGTMEAGYFGTVSASEFITGTDLASAIGLSAGTPQYSDTQWLKFAYRGNIQFVPMKAIRHSASWDHIYQAGAVYGTGNDISVGEQWMLDNDVNYDPATDRVQQGAQVTIGGLTYKVRLFKGAATDPTDSYLDADRGSIGVDNEWNTLMLPIHERAPSNFNYNQYVDTPTEDWGVGFTDEDLITHYTLGSGSYSWTQETRDDDPSGRVFRGGGGVSFLASLASSYVNSHRGSRFVLELL